MIVDITQLQPGEKGMVVDIQGGWGLIRKLDALGIRRGVKIMKISSQFLRGPVIIQVGGTQVAIGFGMAKRIIVDKI
ncbi:MAG: ferrous iron transport protein A [Caldiserica bacterium]|nr:MAG: ferrous iron transport protein A [Caldisericota bacterium]